MMYVVKPGTRGSVWCFTLSSVKNLLINSTRDCFHHRESHRPLVESPYRDILAEFTRNCFIVNGTNASPIPYPAPNLLSVIECLFNFVAFIVVSCLAFRTLALELRLIVPLAAGPFEFPEKAALQHRQWSLPHQKLTLVCSEPCRNWHRSQVHQTACAKQNRI